MNPSPPSLIDRSDFDHPDPMSALVRAAPLPVAILAERAMSESEPELIVLKCAHTFEIITRIYCFLGMAERAKPNLSQQKNRTSAGRSSKLNMQTSFELGSALRRPSLGGWLASLEYIASIEGQDPVYANEAVRFIHRVRESRIIEQRNDVAHKLGSTVVDCNQIGHIRAALGSCLEDATWFSSLYWVGGLSDGGIIRFDRLGSIENDVPTKLAPGSILLGHRDRRINLSGWLNLEKNTDRPSGSLASLQIFAGYDQRQVHYSVLELDESGTAAFSHQHVTRPMLWTPQVSAWLVEPGKAREEIPNADREFLDIINKETTVFRDISNYTSSMEKESGVILFSGTRGSGKTNLLAQLWNWKRNQSNGLLFAFSIDSSVGSGNSQQFLISFYRFLIKSGVIKPEKRIAKSIFQIRREIVESSDYIGKSITVFLDNVHRALRDQPEVLELLSLTSGSILWICSTREGNASALKERLFPTEYQVPEFNISEIVRFLDNLGGNTSEILFELVDNGKNFLELIAEKSNGNPTYIEYVHNDLRTRPINEVMQELPRGLQKWIERNYLEKEATNDFERREAEIRWMVAATFAPISLATVLEFFGRDKKQSLEAYQRAFELGTPEVILDQNGLLRFRDSSFYEVLGSSQSNEIAHARNNIAERAKTPHLESAGRSVATTRYLFEFGCRHLESADFHSVGQELLRDLGYLVDRFKTLGSSGTPVDQIVHSISGDWARVLGGSKSRAYPRWRAESHMLSRLESHTEAPIVLEQMAKHWDLNPRTAQAGSSKATSRERLVRSEPQPRASVTVLDGHHAPITTMRANPWQDKNNTQFVSVDEGGTVIVWGVRWADRMVAPTQGGQSESVVLDAVWLMIDTLALLYDDGSLFLWALGKSAGRANPLSKVDMQEGTKFAGVAADPHGSPRCFAWTRGGMLKHLSLSYGIGHRTVVATEVSSIEMSGGVLDVSVISNERGISVLAWLVASGIQLLDESLTPIADSVNFGPAVRSFYSSGHTAVLLQDAFHRVMLFDGEIRVARQTISDVLSVDWKNPKSPGVWTGNGAHAFTEDFALIHRQSAPSFSRRLARAVPVSSGMLVLDVDGYAFFVDWDGNITPAFGGAKLHPSALPVVFGTGGAILDNVHSRLLSWDERREQTGSLESPVHLALSLSSDIFVTASDDFRLRLYKKGDDFSGNRYGPLLGASVSGMIVSNSGLVISWCGTDQLTIIGRPGDTELRLDQWVDVRCCDGQLAGVLLFEKGILTWGEDGSIRYWEITASGGLRHLRDVGHHGAAVSGAFIYENDRLVSWSADGTVRVWPLSSHGNREVLIFSEFLDGVKDVSPRPDEKLAVRTSDDRWFICYLDDASCMLWKSAQSDWLTPAEEGESIRCDGRLGDYSVMWSSTWVALTDYQTSEEHTRWYSLEPITHVALWREKAVVVACTNGAILKLVIEKDEEIEEGGGW